MIRGAIVDLDGCVYRGDSLVPGAATAIERLRERDIAVLFCSNNPTKTPAEYVDRLANLGIEVTERMVLPASTVTRDYLREHHPEAPTYVVGSDSLAAYLRASGQSLVTHPREATVCVVSWDDRFDYGTMADALDGIDEETTVIGTDPDRTVPTDDGLLPGSGAIIAAIAGTIGRDPDRVLGKPADETARAALDRLGVTAAECVVVGDRLDTDLEMGARNGMTTALVRTGVSDDAALAESAVDPDYVLDSLADLPDALF